MTRLLSFLNWRLSSLFSGLASGVRRLASSSPSCPLSSPDWRLASGVRRLSSGFSLVEVTLALMVMAIGILSIMSLFPAGLDQNLRSIADTHAAFFAEEVFAGLHAKAETNWAGLEDFNVPVAATNMWVPPTNRVEVTDTNIMTIIYTLVPYEDHALRYRLVVTNIGVGSGLLKAATLFVWPGEFGSANDPAMFYAEFFKWKP